MSISLLRLFFASFWLVIGIVLFFRKQLGLAGWDDAVYVNLNYMAMAALLFSAWQFRGYFLQQRRLAQRHAANQRNALAPRGTHSHEPEYLPEFDFKDPPRAS
jgi:hypothetical protein